MRTSRVCWFACAIRTGAKDDSKHPEHAAFAVRVGGSPPLGDRQPLQARRRADGAAEQRGALPHAGRVGRCRRPRRRRLEVRGRGPAALPSCSHDGPSPGKIARASMDRPSTSRRSRCVCAKPMCAASSRRRRRDVASAAFRSQIA
jgi:hypothetical protein